MNIDLFKEAELIARFLSNYHTEAGVSDPDEGLVLRHSYTTEFFAWVCALLYRSGFGDEWLDSAIQAANTALAFIEDGHYSLKHSQTARQFHWEFKNLALINVERLIRDQLSAPLRLRLHQVLQTWSNLNIDSTNWMAMRALSYEMRYKRFGRPMDRWRSLLELELVLSQQTPEGFFPDTPHSHSMQYHAYILSLLALSLREANRPRVREAFLRGVRFVADFIDPAGDFNYYGRGQRQLFGYASLILAFSEAVRLCTDTIEAMRYYGLIERTLQFVRDHRCSDGSFPLVLNHSNGRWGWYDYNNRGDYLSFCAVWFLLAAAVLKKKGKALFKNQFYTRCYPGLGLAVAARPGWFASFSAGGDDLSEPVGLIHLWPAGPLCLGGPEPDRAMGIDYHWNYFGPLINKRPVLQRQRGKMSADSAGIHLSFSLPEVKIRQTYRWCGGLSFEQRLDAKGDKTLVVPLFIAGAISPPRNLRWQTIGQAASPAGPVTQFISEVSQTAQPSNVAVELAPQYVLPQEKGSLRIFGGQSLGHRSIWRRILKFIWVLGVKGNYR